jgi:predicted GTPase
MGQQNAKTNDMARTKTQQIKIKSSISFWEGKTNYASKKSKIPLELEDDMFELIEGKIIKQNHIKITMIKEQDYIFKIVLVGNQGVGKSSLFLRFCDNNFIENYLTTIGVDFRFRMLDVDDKVCKLQIWDTAGQ